MRIRKTIIVLVLFTFLFLSLRSSNLSNNQSVNAWGIPTHQTITSRAMLNVDDEWLEAFNYYAPEVLSGCTYPDQVLQDWENHLYYPDQPDAYNAHKHINNTVYGIRAYIEQEDWLTAFFLLGVVSHYTADINIPVHTDSYWSGHPAYETDINNHLGSLEYETHDFDQIDDPVQFIVECATYAHQYYWIIRDAYPTGTTKNIVNTNETIKTITEEQLGRAIGAMNALWNLTLTGYTPPEIEELENVATVLIDVGHGNDYTEEMTSLVGTLDRDIVEINYIDTEITAYDLMGVDLLIITALDGENAFTEDEMVVISNWYKTGNHILMSSRGDYNHINYASMNLLLENISSQMRINDDNVYTTDPEAYQAWYCLTDNYNTNASVADIFVNVTQSIRLFSPSSLYAIDETNIEWVVKGSEYFYQEDTNPQSPEVTYTNGSEIPMAGLEKMNDSSIAIFGSTIWSDYDFGLTDRDNVLLTLNTIEHLLDIDLVSNDDPRKEEPTIPSETETTAETKPDDPTITPGYTIFISFIAVSTIVSIMSIRKKR